MLRCSSFVEFLDAPIAPAIVVKSSQVKSNQSPPRHSAQLTLASSAAGCRCAIAAVLPPAAPRAVADTPLSAALSPLLRKSTSAAAPMAYCRHLCRARTRMREIWCVRGVARTAENALDHSCRRRASRPCCLAENDRRALVRPKTPKLVGEGQRALDARRRWSPDPTDALAHRNSPRAGPRSLPSSAWEPCCIAVL